MRKQKTKPLPVKPNKEGFSLNLITPVEAATDLILALLKLKKNPMLVRELLRPKARLTRLLELLNMRHLNTYTPADHEVIKALIKYTQAKGDDLLNNGLRAEQACMLNQPLPRGTNLTEWGLFDDE